MSYLKRYLYVKRFLDFIFALIILTFSSWIMLLASVAIKLESKGPILFKQQRPGKDCEIFTVFKFRTMIVETEKEGMPLSDIERITKIGLFFRMTSIDELPQLFNILRGEMSFIGTRPLLVQYLDLYSPEERRRHEVIPGISGWAQVNGRNCLNWNERLKFDVWYVENQSFLLDFYILILTIKKVILREGINKDSTTTSDYFKGNF